MFTFARHWHRAFIAVLFAAIPIGCATTHVPCPPTHMIGVEHVTGHALRQPDAWYRTPEARRFADILVSWQNPNGGWWKKYDPTRPRPARLPDPDPHDGPSGDSEAAWRPSSTFDNTATYTEMRILARAYAATHVAAYRKSFLRGLNFIFASQYANGGWPQRYPLPDNYGREITFNDDAMTNVMVLLKDIADGRPEFAFVPDADRERCRRALARGIECTLRCQVRSGGTLTAWSQQYDADKLAPAKARAYELPALSSSESANIALFLMTLPRPDARVTAAIEASVRWFRESQINGKRVEVKTGPEYQNGRDRVVVDDVNAPPIWARFYDLQTNQPFFVGRDGVKKASVAEISYERRNGYGWYGEWGSKVERGYADWKGRAAVPATAKVLTVSANGAGDFHTVQAAVDAISEDNAETITITVRAGTYHERVWIPKSKPHVTLRGEGADTTSITFDRNAHFIGADGKEVGTFKTHTIGVDASDFTAENITFENTAGDQGQALALSTTGDRQIYRNCRLLGWQDTLFANGGRQYYNDCHIEGRVDFIFGSATAVFDHCTIISKNGGYLTAANTPPEQPFGYVFLDCTLTGNGDEKPTYLGRPWRWDRGSNASVTFVRCKMGPHVHPEGWNPWHRGPTTQNTHPETNTRYSEFGSTDLNGKPLDVSMRVPWSHQLTAGQAADYTVEHVLAGPDHWDPAAGPNMESAR